MIPHTTTITCYTDLPCPVSGIWESMGNFKTTCTMMMGCKMPYYCNQKTVWRLIQEG